MSNLTVVFYDTESKKIMGKIYGYVRISTKKQNMERQIRNIQKEYPEAVIIKEVYTGTKFQGRKELNKLIKQLKVGDTIVFDSVSRMSRDAEEGFQVYQDLYEKGIELIFLKEHHIDTTTYKSAINNGIPLTGTNVDYILEGVNKYLLSLAKKQIRLAFLQSQKEVMDLRQRTKEGMETARMNNKQIGLVPGTKLITKKSIECKKQIQKYSRDFDGMLSDKECIQLIGIARGTYYKYKREIKDGIC